MTRGDLRRAISQIQHVIDDAQISDDAGGHTVLTTHDKTLLEKSVQRLGGQQPIQEKPEETKMKLTKETLKQIIAEEIENILSEEGAERTAKGNITQDTREKYATVGKDKFPIFDKKSAEAAIDLRGHAPEKDRARIINKAAKYAPEAAKKAREADKAE